MHERLTSPLADLARAAVARAAAIEALPDISPFLSRELIRTAAEEAQRRILAQEPASIADAVIQLKALAYFAFDRLVSEHRRDRMDDADADVIVGGLHDIIAFLAKEGGVPKDVSNLKL